MAASRNNQDTRFGTIAYIGQCPAEQLETLLSTMQHELEKLLVDMDMDELIPANQATSQTHYRKLALHTAALTRLNKQAHTRLNLAAQPTS